MGSITTTTAINQHLNLWLRSDTILNSSPLLFFTLSLLFLPLTLTIHDVITPKTLTPADVIIKTLTIIIITFTTATSLIIIRTTRPRLTLISAVKSFPPLFTTVITETALLLLSALAIAFSPFAVTELLGLGFWFDANLVKLGVVFVLVVSVVYMMVIWGFSAPVAVLEGRYGIAANGVARRDYEVSGYVNGDGDKVGGQGFTLLFNFVLFVWVGTTTASLL